jgi:hypothetical protein
MNPEACSFIPEKEGFTPSFFEASLLRKRLLALTSNVFAANIINRVCDIKRRGDSAVKTTDETVLFGSENV